MATLIRPDQTFYPSPRLAAEAPVETLAYMVTFDPTRQKPDGLVTLDVDRTSKTFGQQIGRVDAPNVGDEFHHFGWNVCSSALCPYAAHPHLERRYLLVPGLRSSRIYVFDVKPERSAERRAADGRAEATAHGAGLMLAPVLLGLPVYSVYHSLSELSVQAAAAATLHVAAMLITMGVVSVVVYEKVGLGILRRGWFNLDLGWSFVLIASGAVTLLTTL